MSCPWRIAPVPITDGNVAERYDNHYNDDDDIIVYFLLELLCLLTNTEKRLNYTRQTLYSFPLATIFAMTSLWEHNVNFQIMRFY